MNTYIVTTNGKESTRAKLAEYGKVGKPKFVHEVVIIDTGHDKETLLSIQGVESVEEDGEDALDEEHLSSNWALPWISQTTNRYVYSRTGKGVNVYVVDTGVRITHNEFGGRVQTLYSYDGEDYGDGEHSHHGTKCAALVGGKKFGVAKEVGLYNLRTSLRHTSTLKCLEKIMEHHENGGKNSVLSMSLSSSVNPYKPFIQKMHSMGICMVGSAGNDSGDIPLFPARNKEMLSVGAIRSSGEKASFSNRQADIWAPGQRVKTASFNSDDGYSYFTGTSASCPLTAGALALVLEGSDRLRNGDDVEWAYEELFKYSRALEIGRGLSNKVDNEPFTAPEQRTPEQRTPEAKKEEGGNKKKIVIGVLAAIVIGAAVYFLQ